MFNNKFLDDWNFRNNEIYLFLLMTAAATENEHDNPWLFVIDKRTLEEFLIPSESGKRYITVNEGNRSQSLSIEEWLHHQIKKFKSDMGLQAKRVMKN